MHVEGGGGGFVYNIVKRYKREYYKQLRISIYEKRKKKETRLKYRVDILQDSTYPVSLEAVTTDRKKRTERRTKIRPRRVRRID